MVLARQCRYCKRNWPISLMLNKFKCLACYREVTQAKALSYYYANRNARLVYGKQYHVDNRDRILERCSLWREDNRERITETGRRWYEANQERVREVARLWREGNRKYVRARDHQYRENRPEVGRAKKLRRRARKRNLPDTLTAQGWQHCLDYFGCCVACGSTENLHADHWVPLSFEGDNPGTVARNMIPLCGSCNSSKSNANAEEWLAWKYPEDKDLILEAVAFYFESL